MKRFLFTLSFLLLTQFAFAPSVHAQIASTKIVAMTAVTATTASTQVLNSDLTRNYLLIVNTGAVSVIVKFVSVQSASEGITIPAGGNYEPAKAITDAMWIKSASSTASVTLLTGTSP